MKLIFNPPENPENKYIKILTDPLREYGHQVFPLEALPSRLSQLDLIHLNWFENVTEKGVVQSWLSFLKKSMVLNVIQFGGKKLIWTLHNRISHEKKSGGFSRLLTNRLIKMADAIVIHSRESEHLLAPVHRSKTYYIPHPDFIGSYGSIHPSVKSQKLQLLFIGAVKPYKNIELLIEVVKEFQGDVELTIAGKPFSSAYQEQLETTAAGYPGIRLMLKFIDDHELPELIAASDLLVLPYDLTSSLNSGTVILAFSYQRSIICPAIGTLKDMVEMEENFFSYSYTNSGEHRQQLKSKIEAAFQLKTEAPGQLEKMGKKMFDYVAIHHSKTLVAEALQRLYDKVKEKK
jgi:beta-1,4-mannosyltransferase